MLIRNMIIVREYGKWKKIYGTINILVPDKVYLHYIPYGKLAIS